MRVDAASSRTGVARRVRSGPRSGLGELAFEHYGIRPSMSPPQLRTPGPNLGEHNDEILGGLLGYTPEEIRDLTEREILV